MGYTVFETEKDGLYAELTFLVPIGENCEVQRVRLTNRSAETKRFPLHRCRRVVPVEHGG